MKSNKKILVTGGAGFIGSHLADELLTNNCFVRVIDNLQNGSLQNISLANKNSNFEFIKGDILNKKDCQKAVKGIDVVYHLACLGVRHSLHSPFENHRVNSEGTLNILEAALQQKIKKFFYISTSEVYGEAKTFPITETTLTFPTTIYGSSKLAGENYAHAYNKCFGMDTTVLRIFNNYGPRAHYEGDAGEIIPRTIVNVLYGKQPVIFGDGRITRDFFFVKDTARALCKLMKIKDLKGITMNIGTGEEITMKELAETILKLMKKEKLGIQYIESRPADVPRLWVNADKFYKLTKFKPSLSFEEGLKITVDYYVSLMEKKNLLSDIQQKNWKKKK